jgi:hypothetical protein
MEKKPEIVFAPGCFDHFEGSQEELDALIAEITELVNSGEIFEKSSQLDLDDLDDEDRQLLENIINEDSVSSKRSLQ